MKKQPFTVQGDSWSFHATICMVWCFDWIHRITKLSSICSSGKVWLHCTWQLRSRLWNQLVLFSILNCNIATNPSVNTRTYTIMVGRQFLRYHHFQQNLWKQYNQTMARVKNNKIHAIINCFPFRVIQYTLNDSNFNCFFCLRSNWTAARL